ncbi:MAG TPA: LOG family protein [Dehalococcoidia bacterium]
MSAGGGQDRPARVVTVFGGSHVQEGSAEYREAERLGRLLAEQGFTVCNGGYLGVMAAVSRGARDAGGHVVGVTLAGATWEGPNTWLSEEVRAETLFLRIEKLITAADAFVVLRGGHGTLAELAMTWNLIAIGAVHPRPLVLVGRHWQALLAAFRRHLTASEEELRLLTLVDSAEAAVAAVAALVPR